MAAAGLGISSSQQQAFSAAKQEEDSEPAQQQPRNSLSASVSSLKRPFRDADESAEPDSRPVTAASSGQEQDESSSGAVAAKKQRRTDNNEPAEDGYGFITAMAPVVTPYTNSTNSDLSDGSAYAPSPSMNLNTSPYSGSHASSLIPTPN